MATESVTTPARNAELELRRLAEDAYNKLNAALPTLTESIQRGGDDVFGADRELAGWLAVWAIRDAHDALEKVWKGEV